MCLSISVHHVARIEVSAVTCHTGRDITSWWQILTILNQQGEKLGEVVAFLESPGAALPIGDQPPYWGMDLTKPAGLMDGESPF
jgi:hypothetical protein